MEGSHHLNRKTTVVNVHRQSRNIKFGWEYLFVHKRIANETCVHVLLTNVGHKMIAYRLCFGDGNETIMGKYPYKEISLLHTLPCNDVPYFMEIFNHLIYDFGCLIPTEITRNNFHHQFFSSKSANPIFHFPTDHNSFILDRIFLVHVYEWIVFAYFCSQLDRLSVMQFSIIFQ